MDKELTRIAIALEGILSHLTSEVDSPKASPPRGEDKIAEVEAKQKAVADAKADKAAKAKADKAAKAKADKAAKAKADKDAKEPAEDPSEEITVESVAQQVRNLYAAAGAEKQAKKGAYATLREEFEIDKLSDLEGDDRLVEFSARVAKL